jgi:hypothetical protein
MSWIFSQAMMDAYENSRSLQGQVEEYSAAKSLDGEPSAQLNVMPTPQMFWHRDRMIEASNLSRYGLTCRVLTDDLGEELLTWFRAGFRAKTSQLQEKGQELAEKDRGSGLSLRESYAKYDHATSSWRTPQCSLFEDLPECLETLPRWGSMRNGELYPRKIASGILAIRQYITNANESGLSQRIPTHVTGGIDGGSNSRKAFAERSIKAPTPTVCGNYNRKGASPTSGDGLATWAQKCPTPVANDGASAKRTNPIKGGIPLREFVQKCPTPRVNGMCGGTGSWELLNKFTTPEEARAMGAGNGGTLNPLWVEWLMGWPIGWTGLEPLETVKYPSVPLPLFKSSEVA